MSQIIPIKPIYLTPRAKVALSMTCNRTTIAGRWSMAEIIDLVADAYGLSVELLKGHRRHRHIAWPRQHAMWLMAQQPHLSLPKIGRFLGDRDHTTIIHGRDAFARRWAEFNQTAEAA